MKADSNLGIEVHVNTCEDLTVLRGLVTAELTKRGGAGKAKAQRRKRKEKSDLRSKRKGVQAKLSEGYSTEESLATFM